MMEGVKSGGNRKAIGVAAACAAAVVLTVACSGGKHRSGTPPAGGTPGTPNVGATAAPRPAGVPADAVYVDADRVFGVETRTPASNAPPPQLFALACKDGLLSLVTSQILELYAVLPCDRAAPPRVADLFVGHPVTVRVTIGAAEKLRLESPSAGTLEFTVEGVWVKQ